MKLQALPSARRLSTLLISTLLLIGCAQTPPPSPPASNLPPGNPTPRPGSSYYQSVGIDAYIDASGQVRQVAVPFVHSTKGLTTQAVLPGCTPSIPGALFYKRFTFPSDPQLEGVNSHMFTLDHLTTDLLPIPYDAPVRQVDAAGNITYAKDSTGQYLVQKAYPDVYLLGGIGGDGPYGRELYFGFHYLRSGTFDGLPGYEPYLQLTDPRTGRISVVNVRTLVDGSLRTLKLKALKNKGITFEVMTTPENVTKVYLNVSEPMDVQLFKTQQVGQITVFQRDWATPTATRYLLWEGTIADIQGNPDTLGNQIRKFEARVNYGPFLQNGVVYTGNDIEVMNQFVAGRPDFAMYTPLSEARFGELGKAQWDASDVLISKEKINPNAFELLPDIRQKCATTKVTETPNSITLGDQTRASSYQPVTAETMPIMMSRPLPGIIGITGSIGMLASEPVEFAWLGPREQGMSSMISYPLSSNYLINVRTPNALNHRSNTYYGSQIEGSGYALDFICQKNGHYDIPITLWATAVPEDKKKAVVSLDCVDNAPFSSPNAPDDSQQVTLGNQQSLNLYGKVGTRIGTPVPFSFANATSFRLKPSSSNPDLDARLAMNLGLVASPGVLVSYACTTAGTVTRSVTLTSAAGSVNVPVNITCGTADQEPLPLPTAASDATVESVTPSTTVINGYVGETSSTTTRIKFTSSQPILNSQFSLVSPSDLLVTAENARENELLLNTQFKCVSKGQFTRQVTVRTGFTSAATIPVNVTINCQGVEITPMTMFADQGTTASGSTTITGVRRSINLSYPGTLPTSMVQNADGSFTLNSTYTCTNAGTFNPNITATIDGMVYTVPVTVTCRAVTPAVSVTPMSISGTVGQSATGTSTVTGVKSSISLSYSSDLPTTATRNADGSYKLTSTYTCSAPGTFNPILKATVDGTQYTVPVTVTCSGSSGGGSVQINPITMSGNTGQTLTGVSTVRGVTSSISVLYSSDLPTTLSQNADGTFKLTSQYTCTTAGTFNPTLKVTADGTQYTVPVTVTCTGSSTPSVSITPITMSGSRGQTLTGTSTVKGVKSSISVTYASSLPTTIKGNTDGSYTLTSKYTCTTTGTFKPSLTAKIDGTSYPVSVTVTCK